MNKDQREGLRGAIFRVSGGAAVIFDHEPVPFVGPSKGLITLTRVANRVSGIPDKRQTSTADGSQYVTTIEWRYQTIAIRYDSYNPSVDAVDFLSDLSTFMWRDSNIDALTVVSLTMVDSGDIHYLPHMVDDHIYSSANMDLIVGYAFADTDVTNDVGQILTVDTDNEVPLITS